MCAPARAGFLCTTTSTSVSYARFSLTVCLLDPKSLTFRQRTQRGTFYKIDAANICLTIALSQIEGMRAPFVSTTPLNVRQCTVGQSSLARLERTPFIQLATARLEAAGLIESEESFLREAARRSFELAR